jgi:hypothetical protein
MNSLESEQGSPTAIDRSSFEKNVSTAEVWKDLELEQNFLV